MAELRSCKLRGNELDINKAASLIIDDFRSGKLGKITLEFPELPEENNEEEASQPINA